MSSWRIAQACYDFIQWVLQNNNTQDAPEAASMRVERISQILIISIFIFIRY